MTNPITMLTLSVRTGSMPNTIFPARSTTIPCSAQKNSLLRRKEFPALAAKIPCCRLGNLPRNPRFPPRSGCLHEESTKFSLLAGNCPSGMAADAPMPGGEPNGEAAAAARATFAASTSGSLATRQTAVRGGDPSFPQHRRDLVEAADARVHFHRLV